MAKHKGPYKGSQKQEIYARLGQEAEDFVQDINERIISPLVQERDSYKRKSSALDVALKYLRNGTLKISDNDKKIVGDENIGALEKVVKFNERYDEEKNKPPKVVTKTVTKTKTVKTTDTVKYRALEKEKKEIEKKYNDQKAEYDKRIAELEKKYARAYFVAQKLEELRKKPLSEYEAAYRAMKEQKAQEQSGNKPESRSKKNAFDELVQSTYFEGNSTEAIYYVEDVFDALATEEELDNFFGQSLKNLEARVKGKSSGDSSQ